MKVDEGVVQIRKMNANAKLPTRGTPRSVGYDVMLVQFAVIPALAKVLVKTGLAMALPPGCYDRVSPR